MRSNIVAQTLIFLLTCQTTWVVPSLWQHPKREGDRSPIDSHLLLPRNLSISCLGKQWK